jgi:hypothetical protein
MTSSGRGVALPPHASAGHDRGRDGGFGASVDAHPHRPLTLCEAVELSRRIRERAADRWEE